MAQFRLCRVSSQSAISWIAFARTLLGEARGDAALALPDDAIDTLEAHLDDWEQAASIDEEMSLEAEMAPEQLEYLGHIFCRLSSHAVAQADARGYDISPTEGDEFFAALSESLIVSLEQSGETSSVEFAGALRNQWPRTDRLLPDGTLLPVSGRLLPDQPAQDTLG